MDTALCSRCREQKPLSGFYLRYDRGTPRLTHPCIECRKALNVEKYKRKRVPVPAGFKRCPQCVETKPVGDFGPNRSRPDGKQTYCHLCWSERQRTYAAGNREITIEAAPIGEKPCRRCGITKPLSDFRPDLRALDKRQPYCVPCHDEFLRLRWSRSDSMKPPEGFKRCSRCREIKPATGFYKNAARSDRLTSYCKACFHLVPAAERAETKWRHSEKGKVYRSNYMREYVAERRSDPAVRRRQEVRVFTRLAVLVGMLTKGPCEVCGITRVDAHHEDYTKPLEVRWLCREHHRARHDAMKSPLD